MANEDVSSSIRNRVYRNIYQELHPGLLKNMIYYCCSCYDINEFIYYNFNMHEF